MMHNARLLRKEEPSFMQPSGLPHDARPNGIYPVPNQLHEVTKHKRPSMEAFDLLDKDRDGEISRQEFHAAEAELAQQKAIAKEFHAAEAKLTQRRKQFHAAE